jgi:hypothetical protein
MSREYHYQGTLDGLCGHYAIINALTVCRIIKKKWSDEETEIFREIAKLCPEVYEGMYFRRMDKVLSSRKLSRIMKNHSISFRKPFTAKSVREERDVQRYKNQLFCSEGDPMCNRANPTGSG